MKRVLRVTDHLYRYFYTRTQPTVRPKSITKGRFLGGTLFGALLAGVTFDGLQNDFENVQGAERFFRSLRIGISISVDYALSLRGLEDDDIRYEKVLKEVHKRSAEKLLQGCLENGGLYIKIGQGVAAVNHIIPKEYCETLHQLEDQCLNRKPDEVRRLFEEDFGAAPEKIFASFDYEPIAAASLAQVFRATTKAGDPVAVKVQYADLRKRFDGDLRTILFLQKLVALLHRNYNFGWIVEDLQGTLREELDFVHEAKNAEQCAADLKKYDFLYVPKVFWELTNVRVLTTEFIDGHKISDRKEIGALRLNLADIDRKLFRVFGEQIFATGFVHADPHPGNVFVRKNPINGKLQIVLLDHGLYEHLTQEVRTHLCRFWEAIVLRDHKAMAEHSAALHVSDYRTFAEILLQRPLELKSSRFSTRLTEEDLAYMTHQAKEHFDRVMVALKQMPRNMILVIRNLNTIRSIARDHGDPIDRSKVMAQCALAALRQSTHGVRGFILLTIQRLRFEFQLWRQSFHYWIIGRYLNILTRLGRSPDTSHLMNMQVEV